jgi:hypothetical protein
VIKVGSPYVPLEISHPKHRRDLLITTCDCRVVLTHRALRQDLPEMVVVLLDADMALWAEQSGIPPPSLSVGQPAYIIFTSGSTGVPKGVVGTAAPDRPGGIPAKRLIDATLRRPAGQFPLPDSPVSLPTRDLAIGSASGENCRMVLVPT